MATQADRLQQLRKYYKLSQTDFGKAINLSRTAIANVESNSGNFELKNYLKIVEIYNVSLDWLILGVGEMFFTKEKPLLSKLKEEGVEADSDGYLKLT